MLSYILMGHVAELGEMKSAHTVLVRRGEEKRPFGKRGWRWVLNRQGVRLCTGFIQIKIFPLSGVFEQDSKYVGVIQTGNFLTSSAAIALLRALPFRLTYVFPFLTLIS
jgi:hypothetical protein